MSSVKRGKVERGVGPYWVGDEKRPRYRVVHKRAGNKNGFRTRKAAEDWLRRKLNELDQGTHVPATRSRKTFGPFAEEWLADFELGIGTKGTPRPTTVARHRSTLDKHILPHFAGKPFRDIDLPAVEAWLRKMKRKPANTRSGRLSAATVAKAYRLLSQILKGAVQKHYLSGNPCAVPGAATEPKPDESKYEDLDPDLVRQLAAHMRDEVWWEPRATKTNPDRNTRRHRRHARYKALVLLAGLEGPRWGECIALQRKHVDLTRGTVRIRQQVVELHGRPTLVPYTKTDAGHRTIYLTGETVAALAYHLATFVDPEPAALLFPAREREGRRGYLRRGNFRRSVWLPAVQALDLDDLEGLVFHDLRHAAGMQATAAGLAPKEVMNQLGHKSMTAYLRYQHVTEASQADAVQKRNEYLARNRRAAATGTENVVPFRKSTT